jgi:hypothetical protein
MRKKDFDNLVASIRQARKIRRGKIKPSRVTDLAPKDIKSIRRLRARLAKDIDKARQEFQKGKCQSRAPADLMKELFS